ncbi:hypothetical protein ACHAWF_001647 [Thalassiosira exigua]
MASLFGQLSDDMERVAQVVEEGMKFMMGSTAHMGEDGNDAPSDPTSSEGGGGGDGDVSFDDLEDAYDSPLMGMADSVMSDIMSNQVRAMLLVGPQTPKEHIQAFTAAITWSEPFIKLLLAFHVLVIVAVIALSRRGGMYSRMCLMVFFGVIIRLAEWLNGMGARRWREFATQNYFDRNGIFMGIMVCAPLLMVCMFMLVSMIREASNLLVEVKQMKVKSHQRQKQGEKKKEKKDGKRKKKD